MAILLAMLLMALPVCAGAEGMQTGADAGQEESLGSAVRSACDVIAASFSRAFERTRDEDVLRAALAAIKASMSNAGENAGEYLSSVLGWAKAGAEKAGAAAAGWLAENRDEIGEAADRAGEGIGKAANAMGNLINSLFD